jgi:hypothetical protein
VLPDGAKLVTLRQAAQFILKLPKTEYGVREWQTAMRVLIEAADHGGSITFARIGMTQALQRHEAKFIDPPRKERSWLRRKRASNEHVSVVLDSQVS